MICVDFIFAFKHFLMNCFNRKMAQPIYMQSKDPSKFWELMNSVENPMKFPHPLPTTRPVKPLPSSAATAVLHHPRHHHPHTERQQHHVSLKKVRQGFVSMDGASIVLPGPKLTAEALMRANGGGGGGIVLAGGSVISGGGGSNTSIKGGGGVNVDNSRNATMGGFGASGMSLRNVSQQSINLNDLSRDPIIGMSDSMQVDASNLSTPSGTFMRGGGGGGHQPRSHERNTPDDHRKKRASSAPASNRSPASSSHHSSRVPSRDEYDGYSSRTESVLSDHSHRNSRNNNLHQQHNEVSQHLAKWSNNTLAEYYHHSSKEGGASSSAGGSRKITAEDLMAGTGNKMINTEATRVHSISNNNNQQQQVQTHYESHDSRTASPSSFASGSSTISRGTFNFSKQPVSIRGGGGGGKKSIREDLDNQIKLGAANAPFATDLK
jgi:hypothetical protein